MKQGKCESCKVRWVSDKDFGNSRRAKCPSCNRLLLTTTHLLKWPIRIHPNATDEFRKSVRTLYAETKDFTAITV